MNKIFNFGETSSWITRLLDAFFLPREEEKMPLLSYIWLAGLFLTGIFLWGKFLSWTSGPFNFADWANITMPRLDMMRDALRMGTLPFHAAHPDPSLMGITDRFFALPDVITTPQMLLLLFVNLNTFILIDVFLHFTIGMLGLLWIRRKKGLSLFAFTVLFLLFNFNGYILAHYSVGHFTWGGYFLFPIVFGFIFEFLEKEVGWKWVSGLACVLFYIVLAGGEHHFVWLLLFIAPLAFISWKHAKWIILLIICAGLLSAVRLLPPALELQAYAGQENLDFVLGYPSVAHLLQAMIVPTVAAPSPIQPFALNAFSKNNWEFNYYLGILGTLFILYFGIWHWFRYHLDEYLALVFPTFFVLFLSLGNNFWLVRETGLPLFGSERVTSRIVSVPITLIILLAVIFMQKWLDAHYNRTISVAVGFSFLIFLFSDLWENMKLWRLMDYAGYFKPTVLNLDGNSLANHADPPYYATLAIGLGITLLLAVFLCIMSWRDHRANESEPQ